MNYKKYLNKFPVSESLIIYIYYIENRWEEFFQKKIEIPEYIQLLKLIRKDQKIYELSFEVLKKDLSELFRTDLVEKTFDLIDISKFLSYDFRYKLGVNQETKNFYKILALIQMFLIVNPWGTIEDNMLLENCKKRLCTFFPKNIFSNKINVVSNDDDDVDLFVDKINEVHNSLVNNSLVNNSLVNNSLVNNSLINNSLINDEDDMLFENVITNDDINLPSLNLKNILQNKMEVLKFILRKCGVKVLNNMNTNFMLTRELVNFFEKLTRFKILDCNGFYFFNYFFDFCLKKKGNIKLLEDVLKELLSVQNFSYVHITQIYKRFRQSGHLDNFDNFNNLDNFFDETKYYTTLYYIFDNYFCEYISIKKDLGLLKKELDDLENKNASLNRIIRRFLSLIEGVYFYLNSGKPQIPKKLERVVMMTNIKYDKKPILFLDKFLYLCFSKNGRLALIKTIESFKCIDIKTASEIEITNIRKLLELEWSYKTDVNGVNFRTFNDTRRKFIKKVENNPRKNHNIKIKRSKKKKKNSLNSIKKRTRTFLKLHQIK